MSVNDGRTTVFIGPELSDRLERCAARLIASGTKPEEQMQARLRRAVEDVVTQVEAEWGEGDAAPPIAFQDARRGGLWPFTVVEIALTCLTELGCADAVNALLRGPHANRLTETLVADIVGPERPALYGNVFRLVRAARLRRPDAAARELAHVVRYTIGALHRRIP